MGPTLGEWILGSIVLSIIAALVGHCSANRSKVTERTCSERRNSCDKLIEEKLETVNAQVMGLHSKISEIHALVKALIKGSNHNGD